MNEGQLNEGGRGRACMPRGGSQEGGGSRIQWEGKEWERYVCPYGWESYETEARIAIERQQTKEWV